MIFIFQLESQNLAVELGTLKRLVFYPWGPTVIYLTNI